MFWEIGLSSLEINSDVCLSFSLHISEPRIWKEVRQRSIILKNGNGWRGVGGVAFIERLFFSVCLSFSWQISEIRLEQRRRMVMDGGVSVVWPLFKGYSGQSSRRRPSSGLGTPPPD